MIIYNTAWLSNLLLIGHVERAHHEGLLSDKELEKIRQKFPVGFYTPNFFIRIGLFILTCVISGFSGSFLSMYLLAGDVLDIHVWLLILGGLNYLALHAVVKKYFHYRSGVDDALLWISFGLLTAAFYWISDKAGINTSLVLPAFVFLLGSFLAVRFADMLMTLAAYLGFLSLIFFALKNAGALGIALMPFVLMLVSGLIYWFVRKSLSQNRTLFYAGCMTLLQVCSLISLYASGNYYLVKELGDALSETKSERIPFGWIFWTITVMLPPVYIYFGLLKKNVILIRSGLVLAIAGILTVWHYYHPIPPEYALVIGGVVVLAISWFLTSYLSSPKNGFTYKSLPGNTLMEELQLESLIISESTSGIGRPPVNTGTQMGGGEFGGGGASGNF